MIRNRLKEIMAKKNLKASRIASDIPNLSRNTINTVANNNGKMLQLETIDSLCQYLDIQPKDFFEYLPFDVEVSVDSDSDVLNSLSEGDMIAEVDPFYLNLYLKKKANSQLYGAKSETFDLSIVSKKPIKFNNTPFDDSPSIFINLEIFIGNLPIKDNFDKQQERFNKFWKKDLSDGFRQIILNRIEDAFKNYWSNELSNKFNVLDISDRLIQFTFDIGGDLKNTDKLSIIKVYNPLEDLPF